MRKVVIGIVCLVVFLLVLKTGVGFYEKQHFKHKAEKRVRVMLELLQKGGTMNRQDALRAWIYDPHLNKVDEPAENAFKSFLEAKNAQQIDSFHIRGLTVHREKQVFDIWVARVRCLINGEPATLIVPQYNTMRWAD